MSAAPKKEVFYDTTVQKGTVKGVYAHLDSLIYTLAKLKKVGLPKNSKKKQIQKRSRWPLSLPVSG